MGIHQMEEFVNRCLPVRNERSGQCLQEEIIGEISKVQEICAGQKSLENPFLVSINIPLEFVRCHTEQGQIEKFQCFTLVPASACDMRSFPRVV